MARSPLGPVLEAVKFAADAHRDQRRKDVHQSPYINHPIEVVQLLTSVGDVTDGTTLFAAVLHDILEDTSIQPAEIERRFGTDVRALVEEVTDPPGLGTTERRQRQLAHAPGSSRRARVIRLADKVASLGALPAAWGAVECRAYLTWMGEMAAALAGTNASLEAEMAVRLKAAWTAAHHRRPTTPLSKATATAPFVELEPAFGAELTKLVSKLQTKLSNAEELSDTICEMLMRLGVNLVPRRSPTPRKGPALVNKHRNRRRFADPIFEELARNGVRAVTFAPGPPGLVTVSVHGAKPLDMPTRAAEVFEALVSMPGSADDGFPPLVSHAELANAIFRKFGRRLEVHALVVALGRLQERLLAGGCSPKLIETRPRRGVRFRVRRSPTTAP